MRGTAARAEGSTARWHHGNVQRLREINQDAQRNKCCHCGLRLRSTPSFVGRLRKIPTLAQPT